MITNFKIFEAIHELPKEGDYVIVKNNKFKNNIGYVTKTRYSRLPTMFRLDVKFDTNFEKVVDNYSTIDIEDVTYWSENKEELEVFINSNKYNL